MRDRARAGTAEAPAQGAHGAYRQALSGKRNERWCTFQVTLKTITPLMGGGVLAGVPDLLMPLRPRAIKNGIAHWWWLRHRAELKNPDDLWAAYARTYGAASGQAVGQAGSALRIVKVDVVPNTVRVGYCFPYKIVEKSDKTLGINQESIGRQAAMGYALFSARGSTDGLKTQQLLESLRGWAAGRGAGSLLVPPGAPVAGSRTPELSVAVAAALDQICVTTGPQPQPAKPCWLLEPGLTATITIAVDRTLMDDAPRWQRLRKALELWSGIGGLGARTSRGLGAFTATAIGDCPFAVPRSHDEFAALFKTDDRRPLPGWRALDKHGARTATDAWLDGVEGLRQFRQARPPPPPPDQGANRPGRSYWPDADVVRQLQGNRFAHAVIHAAAQDDASGNQRRWLTKLFLGAPVVLSFKRGDNDPQPASVTFAREGEERVLNRYPSPVRIRPIEMVGVNGATSWNSVFAFLPAARDMQAMSANVSWPGGEGRLRSQQWQLPVKAQQGEPVTSPTLQQCLGAPALQALYRPRSTADVVAQRLGNCVVGNWTIVGMLYSFLRTNAPGPGYQTLQ